MLISVLLLIAGLVVLTAGAEFFVRGAAGLALRLGLAPLVIGLTVVAMGTSAPELAVSVQSALSGSADIALGNVVGSNIFNILFILGVSAIIIPLVASAQLVRIDVPLMIVVSGLLWWLAADGLISRVEGVLLFAGIIGYTALSIHISRRDQKRKAAQPDDDLPAEAAAGRTMPTWLLLTAIAGGLALLVLGSRMFVSSAVSMARLFGLSELVIGLTIVAGGTSLPEVATSVVAALRGQRDIAVGNVVGSNLFNILCVLGATALLAPAGIPVATGALHFDIPVMLAASLACLPIFWTGGRISRAEGGILLGYYIGYITYLLLHSTHHPALATFGQAVLWFAVPLTLLGLIFSIYSTLGQRRKNINAA